MWRAWERRLIIESEEEDAARKKTEAAAGAVTSSYNAPASVEAHALKPVLNQRLLTMPKPEEATARVAPEEDGTAEQQKRLEWIRRALDDALQAYGRTFSALAVGSVRVLRWLNETLPRHDAHKSDACRFDSPKVDGLHPNPGRLTGHRNSTGRPVRSCCDCVHFCFTTLFYDAVFFTPLHQILSEALK